MRRCISCSCHEISNHFVFLFCRNLPLCYQSDWINYAIIDDIVDTFAPLIRQVETEVDMIDELVLILKESEQSDMLRRIGNCRKRVMSLLRLLTGKADVIKGLIKRYEGRIGRKNMGEIGLFMGDIQGLWSRILMGGFFVLLPLHALSLATY